MIEKKVRKLFDVMDTKKNSIRQLEPMIDSFTKLASADLKDPALAKILTVRLDLFKQHVDLDELQERLIPIWCEHYSEEEIDGLIEFYSSPLGQKVLATKDSMRKRETDISMKWGFEQSKKMIDKLKTELDGKEDESDGRMG